MENLGIFYDHFYYYYYYLLFMTIFTAIGNILRPFGTFCGNLVYFSPFFLFWTNKNLATLENGPWFQECDQAPC
jgi:cytochrome b subunit of formate dehydrogenase